MENNQEMTKALAADSEEIRQNAAAVTNTKLFEGEYRFMKLVWEHEPVRSMELARLCLEKFGWKKSTCFTVLKKLALRGFVKNERATVTALIKEEEVQRQESQAVVEKSFSGSLPAFVTAFLSDRTLTRAEAEELRVMIEKAVEK